MPPQSRPRPPSPRSPSPIHRPHTGRSASLANATKLTGITLSGATTLSVSYAQYQADAVTLDKLTTGDTMTVSAATAAAAAKLQTNTHVAAFTVTTRGPASRPTFPPSAPPPS
jgi:hypothetical protein